jgi:sugar lactone lactonase YvrE
VSSTQLLITTPAINRIDRVTLTANSNGPTTANVATQIVGVAPVSAVRIGNGPGATLAVITSDHTLHLVSEFTGFKREFKKINGYNITAWNPMAADEQGRLWVLVNSGTSRRLIAVSADGELLADYAADVASPYSMTAGHDLVLVVDRTNQRVLQLDAATGVVTNITLANQRPRHAEILAHDEWLVIHDTNPHIGVTHALGGVRTFTPYAGGRWLAGLTQDENGQPIALDFNGRVMQVDAAGRAYRPWLSLTTGPVTTAAFGAGRLWVVSPSDSTVTIVRQGAGAAETVWTDAQATDVLPGEGGAWLVTAAGLTWRSLADPAWRL